MAGLFHFNGLLGAGGPTVFEETYRCYSMAMAGKSELESGDKIILPPSALEQLTRMHVQYPMMFRVENPVHKKRTHVGVSEFTAAEGRCHLPHWIMSNLVVAEGGFVEIRNVQLPKAKFVKFQPHSKDFIEISNPRAVLERQLRTYSALTKGDTLMLTYAKRNYYLDVLECKPADAVGIIETDVEVDFAPPLDYVEPVRVPRAAAATASSGRSSAAAAAAGGAGTSGSPIVIDDDVVFAPAAATGSGGAAGLSIRGGGGGVASAGALPPSALQQSLPTKPAAFLGGSGTISGGSGGGGGGGPTSLAAQAALRRAELARAAATLGDAAAATPKFAKAPAVVPFQGTGYRAGDGAATPGATPVAGGAGSPVAAAGSRPIAGGGVVVSTGGGDAGAAGGGGSGSRPGSAKPRTLNKFEAERAAKAFQGSARSLRE